MGSVTHKTKLTTDNKVHRLVALNTEKKCQYCPPREFENRVRRKRRAKPDKYKSQRKGRT